MPNEHPVGCLKQSWKPFCFLKVKVSFIAILRLAIEQF